jgi:hypothetical protein
VCVPDDALAHVFSAPGCAFERPLNLTLPGQAPVTLGRYTLKLLSIRVEDEAGVRARTKAASPEEFILIRLRPGLNGNRYEQLPVPSGDSLSDGC